MVYDQWTVKELGEVLRSQEFYLRADRRRGKSGKRWLREINAIKDALKKKKAD